MRYKCKNCGHFVSVHASTCKHCGEKNPAIPAYDSTNNKSNRINNNFQIEQNPWNQPLDNEKHIICPICRGDLIIPQNLLNAESVICNLCGSEITNPYNPSSSNSHISKEKKTGCILAALFVFLILCISYCESHNQKESDIPVNTPDWNIANQNQNFELVQDDYYSDEKIYKIERQCGKKLYKLFEKHINEPLAIKILNEDPLKKLLQSCLNSDVYQNMTLCLKSENGIEKEYYSDGTGFKYVYDCYKTTPNADYFALALIVENSGTESFFIEVKVNGKMHNVQFSAWNE